ncbi:MAG: hypothetical protein OEV44_03440 [Spirochaetota bacterium]|nr:hypothetical protein [Spirochaetota bacterium]
MNFNDEINKRRTSLDWSKEIAQKVNQHRVIKKRKNNKLILSGITTILLVIFLSYTFLFNDLPNDHVNHLDNELLSYLVDDKTVFSTQIDQFIEIGFNENYNYIIK